MRSGRAHPLCRLLAILALTCGLAPGGAAAQSAPEYELKAAFVYNFALFVEWPDAPQKDAPFVLCLAGRDLFGRAFDALEGKPVRSQQLTVRRIDPAQGVDGCHMLYIAPAEEMRLGQILRVAAGRAILTVADTEEWSDRGVMINLKTHQGRLTFDVNLGPARRAGLEISSRLLRLASNVRGK